MTSAARSSSRLTNTGKERKQVSKNSHSIKQPAGDENGRDGQVVGPPPASLTVTMDAGAGDHDSADGSSAAVVAAVPTSPASGEVVGSPSAEKSEPQSEASADASLPEVTPPPALSDDLRGKIIKQVEYYFCDENLPTDQFMLKQINKNKHGFVPIGIIASFRKMKKLTQDNSLIAEALKSSTQLVVSSDAKRVRRLNPLPKTECGDEKLRTVLVKNLPEDYSLENMKEIFGAIGGIKNIQIHEPRSNQESNKPVRQDMLIIGKLHAHIEYDTVEAAEKAAKTLNDDQNWRTGMRVELLLKRTGKYGQTPKVWKNKFCEKDIIPDGEEQNVKAELQDQSPEEENLKRLSNENNGRRFYKGKSRQDQIGQGHGTVLSSVSEGSNKPLPGPKMPDGTRGFAMGRGKQNPLV